MESIFGSRGSERVFIFLIARENGYASEIANYFNVDLYGIQKQLVKFENSDVLISKKVGRTRVYEFNPRYPLLNELKAFLKKTLSFYPEEIKEGLLNNRRRPRKRDKPL